MYNGPKIYSFVFIKKENLEGITWTLSIKERGLLLFYEVEMSSSFEETKHSKQVIMILMIIFHTSYTIHLCFFLELINLY